MAAAAVDGEVPWTVVQDRRGRKQRKAKDGHIGKETFGSRPELLNPHLRAQKGCLLIPAGPANEKRMTEAMDMGKDWGEAQPSPFSEMYGLHGRIRDGFLNSHAIDLLDSRSLAATCEMIGNALEECDIACGTSGHAPGQYCTRSGSESTQSRSSIGQIEGHNARSQALPKVIGPSKGVSKSPQGSVKGWGSYTGERANRNVDHGGIHRRRQRGQKRVEDTDEEEEARLVMKLQAALEQVAESRFYRIFIEQFRQLKVLRRIEGPFGTAHASHVPHDGAHEPINGPHGRHGPNDGAHGSGVVGREDGEDGNGVDEGEAPSQEQADQRAPLETGFRVPAALCPVVDQAGNEGKGDAEEEGNVEQAGGTSQSIAQVRSPVRPSMAVEEGQNQNGVDAGTERGGNTERHIGGKGEARGGNEQRCDSTAEEWRREVLFGRVDDNVQLEGRKDVQGQDGGGGRSTDSGSRDLRQETREGEGREAGSEAHSDRLGGLQAKARTGKGEAREGTRLPRKDEVEIVAYGVGSLADSPVARCQLALACLLARDIQAVPGPVWVYDPVLTPLEHRAMRALRCQPILANEEGRRLARGPTLFFMPHCEAHLYNNVLEANSLPPGSLGRIAVLGNSFHSYQERWSVAPRPKALRPTRLLEVERITDEVPVDSADFPLPSAFNDMSWHFFPHS